MDTTTEKKFKPSLVGDKYWYLVMVVCFFGWIFIYGTRTILNPIQTQIAAEFNLSNSDMGFINSIFFLTYTFFQIPMGGISEKIGRKTMAGGSLLLLALMTFVSGIVPTAIMFIMARAIAGITQAGYYGPQYALSIEAIPSKNRTLGLALINSGMAFGQACGQLLSSKLVLQDGMHWSTPFKVIAVPTLIAGIAFFILKEKVIRPEDREKHDVENQESKVEETVNSKLILKEIFTNKKLVGVFLVVFTIIYANFVILTWLPQYLQVEKGFQGTGVGWISSMVSWASIPAAIAVALLADRIKNIKLFVNVLVILSLIATFGIGFVNTTPMLIAVLLLYGCTGKLVTDPIMVGLVSELAPKGGLATTLSAYNFVGMCGAILAPYLTGWLSDRAGSLQVGFYLGTVLLIVGLITFNVLLKDKK